MNSETPPPPTPPADLPQLPRAEPPPAASGMQRFFTWLSPSFPALLGAIVGAWGTGHYQLDIEHDRSVKVESQRVRDRAEEIVTLVAKTALTNLAERREMETDKFNMFAPSSDPERVVALVALYFPDAITEARSYENACVNQGTILSDQAVAKLRGQPLPDDSASFQEAITMGDVLIKKILADVGVPYTPRADMSLSTKQEK